MDVHSGGAVLNMIFSSFCHVVVARPELILLSLSNSSPADVGEDPPDERRPSLSRSSSPSHPIVASSSSSEECLSWMADAGWKASSSRFTLSFSSMVMFLVR